ncbi:MAG: pyrroline-5-carboxylate reductase [Gammaproteobacteria bacterium]
MTKTTIGFIGSGNMARSLIGGLLASGVAKNRLLAADPDTDQRDALARDFGIRVCADNQSIVDDADVIVLAVKPQVIKTVAQHIDIRQAADKLFVSIAAGIRSGAIQQWLGHKVPVVRAMPNTPSLVQSGAAGLYATPEVSTAQRDQAESILRAVGLTLWVSDEAQLDTVTALSGSGPAYFFLVMEAMEKAAVDLGLDPESARLLTVQTAFGAAKLALEIQDDPADLRRKVTSPGGTTEKAIGVLQARHLDDLFSAALKAAHDRSIELAEQLEQD